MPITKLTQLRKLLPVGTEFTAEMIGDNRRRCLAGQVLTRRRVVQQSRVEMASEMLDGPSPGTVVWLTWKFAEVVERPDGAIHLRFNDQRPEPDFLKITDVKAPGGEGDPRSLDIAIPGVTKP